MYMYVINVKFFFWKLPVITWKQHRTKTQAAKTMLVLVKSNWNKKKWVYAVVMADGETGYLWDNTLTSHSLSVSLNFSGLRFFGVHETPLSSPHSLLCSQYTPSPAEPVALLHIQYMNTLTLSLPRGLPLTSKIVWR